MSQPSTPPSADGRPTHTAPAQELSKAYKPAEHEARMWDRWVESGAFHANPARVLSGEAKPYCVLIPPPNVTDRLHLGHALNNSLQDILVRAKRMMGFEALWMPGTDHAGIATQAVVEKRLWNEQKKRRTDFTREQFVERIQAFKDEYEAIITGQLKRMGCSCDWDRQRFTMDDQCATAVREAFFRLFKDGLIYRGKRLVNWDPVLQTAVADDECFEQEIDGAFYYLRYPLVHAGTPTLRVGNEGPHTKRGGTQDAQPVTWNELARRGYPGASAHPGEEPAWVTVATTRPETYLGDTAVAINPHDPRAKSLRGLFVELPLVGRVIPIIEDSYVVLPLEIPGAEGYEPSEETKADAKSKMATGFLKVTPAHDPNDYALGQTHAREIEAAGNPVMVNVMAPDATISDKHGWTDVGGAHVFVGKPREEARKLVVREFEARGLFEGKKPHRHSVKHSDRSKAIIEPYLSDQWYVKVTDERMAQAANRALTPTQRTGGTGVPPASPHGDGQLTFHPARYAKTYELWHENIRDWCISRQLWWGHRVPVWIFQLSQKQEERLALLQRFLVARGIERDVALRQRDEMTWEICARTKRAGELLEALEELCDRFVPDLRRRPGQPYHRDEPRKLSWRFESDLPLAHELDLVLGYFIQDPDVLDTWFSSALWPLSTLGWPDPAAFEGNEGALRAFNPTSTLCTAREIITLWVSRMVMFNRYLHGEGQGHGPVPFKDVFIHAVIQDGHGQKMSKSLGNGVDPLDIIQSHGADAMRFTLCHMTTQTQDVRMPVDLVCPHTGETFTPKFITNKDGYLVQAPVQASPKDPSKKMVTVYGVASGEAKASPETPLAKNTSSKFDLGRNFANKLWNATRFALGMLGDETKREGQEEAKRQRDEETKIRAAELGLLDRWMLSRVESAVREANEALKSYEFSAYAQGLYSLLWNDFCDWYLEGIKPTVAGDARQRAVLAHALETIVRLLHPIMPFVTEAIWENLRTVRTSPIPGLTLSPSRKGGVLCTAGWPEVAPSLRDEGAEREFERARAFVTLVRDVRSRQQVKPSRKIVLHLSKAGGTGISPVSSFSADQLDLISTYCGVREATASPPPASGAVAFAFESGEFAISDLADAAEAGAAADAEKARLVKLDADLVKSIATLEGRLNNPGYAAKAPPHMVQETKDQLDKKKAELAATRQALAKMP